MTATRKIISGLALILIAACGAPVSEDVEIRNAHITEPISGRTVSLGGFEIAAFKEDAVLIEVASSAADRIALHTMLNEDGVMKMRPLPDGLTIQAGQSITLGGGGPHLMVFDLRDDLVAGDKINLDVTYKQKDQIQTVTVETVIQSLGDEIEGR